MKKERGLGPGALEVVRQFRYPRMQTVKYGNCIAVFMTQEHGLMILFRMQGAKNKELARFCKKFYGYKDYSNKGKYIYEREGIISKIPHIKINPIRTALIIKEDDAQIILDALEEFGAEVYTRKIELTPEDREQLGNE